MRSQKIIQSFCPPSSWLLQWFVPGSRALHMCTMRPQQIVPWTLGRWYQLTVYVQWRFEGSDVDCLFDPPPLPPPYWTSLIHDLKSLHCTITLTKISTVIYAQWEEKSSNISFSIASQNLHETGTWNVAMWSLSQTWQLLWITLGQI